MKLALVVLKDITTPTILNFATLMKHSAILSAILILSGIPIIYSTELVINGFQWLLGKEEVFAKAATTEGQAELEFIDAFNIVVIIPIIETLLLSLLVGVLTFYTRKKNLIVAIVSISFAVVHALAFPVSIVFSLLAFIIFTKNYIIWREKGYRYGFIAAIAPHISMNSFAATLMAL